MRFLCQCITSTDGGLHFPIWRSSWSTGMDAKQGTAVVGGSRKIHLNPIH